MLSINISELIWTVINFLLLLFLLRRFLYRPICQFMDARQARIDAGLEEERAAQDALRAEEARQDEEQQEARARAKTLLQKAEAKNAEESREALLSARQDLREAEERDREQMQEHSRQEEDSLAEAEPALAALLARRLLQEEGDGK